MTDPKVAACVDCGTAIIGEISRCGACRDRHATVQAGDEDVTHPRQRPSSSIWHGLLAWFFLSQLVGIVVVLLVLAGKGCL